MNSKKKTTKKTGAGETAGKTASAASSSATRRKVSKKKTTARSGTSDRGATIGAELATASATRSTDAESSGGNGLVKLALIASLLALLIAAYAAYQFTLSGSVTKTQVSGLEERLAFAVQQQQSLQSAFDQQNQALSTSSQQMGDQLAAMQATVDTLKTRSEASIDDIKANLGKSVARWKLDELHSLLTRVNRVYQLTGDQAQALAGLRLAEASLASIDNARLEAVNAALSEDILQVEAARQVDIASLHNRLLGMSRMVPDLVLAEDAREQQVTESAPVEDGSAAAEEESGLLAASKTLINDIGGLVKYKNLDAPLQPSLDDEARFVLYESLNLKLQAAMAALLRRDNDAYQAQLALAADSLAAWFDSEQASVSTFADQLEVMRSYDVSLDVNAISQALDALDRVMVIEN